MIRRGVVVLLCAAALTGVRSANQSSAPLRLWYATPAATWNEALPIGNGRLGAMVFGGVEREHLQLNEDTVWAEEKRDRVNPEGAAALPEIRRLLFAGRAADAEALADTALIAVPRRMPPYQSLGDLSLSFAPAAAATHYRRELDLSDAIAGVRYTADGGEFTREVFSSAPDQAIVIRCRASADGTAALRLRAGRDRVIRFSGS